MYLYYFPCSAETDGPSYDGAPDGTRRPHGTKTSCSTKWTCKEMMMKTLNNHQLTFFKTCGINILLVWWENWTSGLTCVTSEFLIIGEMLKSHVQLLWHFCGITCCCHHVVYFDMQELRSTDISWNWNLMFCSKLLCQSLGSCLCTHTLPGCCSELWKELLMNNNWISALMLEKMLLYHQWHHHVHKAGVPHKVLHIVFRFISFTILSTCLSKETPMHVLKSWGY